MAYKNLTVYDFQNKLNGLLPIYDTNLSLLGISESPGYSNQLCTATSEHIGILQNLQNSNFLTLYYKTSQSSDSTRRLYDEYESAASIIQAEQTVTYGVNNSNDYLNRAYISYTGDPNSGYSTKYSYAINDHIWSTTDMGVGYCLGWYERGRSTGIPGSPNYQEFDYSYTAEQQYKYLFTNFSIGGYEMSSEQNSSSYLMYYTYFKSNIGNCTIPNIRSASWQSINSNSENYPSGSTDMSGSMSAFNWDSTALSNYNNAYYNRSWPSYHADITGMQRSTLQQWTSYVTQSDIESQLNHYISQGDGFIKYLYSPKDPGDVICGRINSTNLKCSGLYVDELINLDNPNSSLQSKLFNVFDSFYGFNSDLNNYHYTPIWVYAAYDITQCRSETWYYNYLLMTQATKYWLGGFNISDWDRLNAASTSNKAEIKIFLNGSYITAPFDHIFEGISFAPCMGYVVIPVALILVCYVASIPANFQSSFLASSINNVQSTNNTYVYPKFSYETYDAFETSTNYKQSINTVVTKVVKCGSSSDTRYLMDFNTPIYWNLASSHFANACLGVPYSPIIYR